jgi:hypothetical protein
MTSPTPPPKPNASKLCSRRCARSSTADARPQPASEEYSADQIPRSEEDHGHCHVDHHHAEGQLGRPPGVDQAAHVYPATPPARGSAPMTSTLSVSRRVLRSGPVSVMRIVLLPRVPGSARTFTRNLWAARVCRSCWPSAPNARLRHRQSKRGVRGRRVASLRLRGRGEVVEVVAGGLHPVLGADLLVDAGQVGLDGARRDSELSRDVRG